MLAGGVLEVRLEVARGSVEVERPSDVRGEEIAAQPRLGLMHQAAACSLIGLHGREGGRAAEATRKRASQRQGGLSEAGRNPVDMREQVRDHVPRIGAEKLVSTEPGENDRHVACRQLANPVGLKQRLPRLVVGLEQIGKPGGDVAWADRGLGMLGPQRA